MVYHLLTEVEPFAEHAGGALSRWVANTLEGGTARVICPRADSSWGFDRRRVLTNVALRLYGKVLKKRQFRLKIANRVVALRWIMKTIVRHLAPGDVLYIHNRPEYVLALPRAAQRNFAVVLHMHNDHLRNLSADEKQRLDPDLIVFNSNFLQTQAAPTLRRTAVLYNGADERCFYPSGTALQSRSPVILFVGRLVPEKGVHVLLEAMRILEDRGEQATARIVGNAGFSEERTSPYVEQLRASAPGNVSFCEYVTGRALAEEYRRASIFCCPSVWDEPFGMVNVEAMASGLPVIATRCGGIPEIFSEGGALLVQRDSAAELASALEQLLHDPALRRQLAREGLTSFQRRFRWSVIATEYQKLMDGLQPLPGSQSVLLPSAALDAATPKRA